MATPWGFLFKLRPNVFRIRECVRLRGFRRVPLPTGWLREQLSTVALTATERKAVALLGARSSNGNPAQCGSKK